MSTTNLAALTSSHRAIAAKKRAKNQQLKEVVFDEDARREFLTGFHKRKLAKTEAARAKAKEREKQERLEARREQRRMLREQALENAASVEKAYGAVIGTPSPFSPHVNSNPFPDDDNDDHDDEWHGIGTGTGSSPNPADIARDEEYENDETLATVTVVEDFDPDTIIHGPPKSEPAPNPIPASTSTSTLTPTSRPAKKPSQPPSSSQSAIKSKSTPQKKIRYQTKDARKREQVKQRARRTEKAELAGGKASRKYKGSSRGGRGKHGSKR
ncbi:unnamed protein product [Cyclocybe aegerita]|uniref:Nucleolar protein 12 n=1 Tax=Cyclocybe aegerita TaxID=1973307 RepID=A0A8S0VSY3_CYCAE|nr:unnamed protein product [Cyclocybe aegerita]